MKTLVLGIGNTLLADEGVGVHVARTLMPWGEENGVDVIDAGTAVIDVIDDICTADLIVIIDAMAANGSPGTIYRVPLKECESSLVIASMHGFDISRVVALAGRREMPEVIVIGVEPKRIEWSLDLSSEVANVVPQIAGAVKQEVMKYKGGSYV